MPSSSRRSEASQTYPVGAVARATGLSEHTLRAWERRYEAVVPLRSSGGTRRYSEDQLRRLLLLKRAVDAGHRIGSLAELSDRAIERLLAPASESAPEPHAEILDAIRSFDAPAAQGLLGRQLAALGPRSFAYETVLPLLRAIGDEWERGRLSAAAEHMASQLLRSLLGPALRSDAPRSESATVLLATPTGERHEFGLLTAALLAAAERLRTIYLGIDLSAEEIAAAAEASGARVVVLAVKALHRSEVRRFSEDLRARLPAAVPLWVGGPESALPSDLDIRTFSDFNDFEAELRKIADSSRQ